MSDPYYPPKFSLYEMGKVPQISDDWKSTVGFPRLLTVIVQFICLQIIFSYSLIYFFRYLPKIYQAILASATLSEDVKSLKSLVLHNPVTLKLEEPDLAPASQLTHYHLNAEENDKAAILYSLLKLRLIRGKTIIFVNTVDKCYKSVNNLYLYNLD